jgi:CPA2 family monovalent cation:H+ antiporter-2
VGEFSFILAVMGLSLNLLPDLGYQLIIAGSIISIALNPLLFKVAERMMGAVTGPRSGVAEPAVGEQSNV